MKVPLAGRFWLTQLHRRRYVLASFFLVAASCQNDVLQTAIRPGEDPVPSGEEPPAEQQVQDASLNSAPAPPEASDGSPSPPEDDKAPGDMDANPSTSALETDCQLSAPALGLPRGAAFGEGDLLEPWPLVGDGYGTGEGPGLYVAGRDTFRVYLNGHLIAQSTEARQGSFIPLSLLPGENVLAITAHADTGKPAAVVHLDDLTRSYSSNSTWKVSASPTGSWQQPGYDDSFWSLAQDLGAMDALPGCGAEDTLPPDSTSRWIGAADGISGPIALRMSIPVRPIGFGAATTGGGGTEPTLAQNWQQFEELITSDSPATILLAEGVHDFRAPGVADDVCVTACEGTPSKLRYHAGEGDCRGEVQQLERRERVLSVASNKTVLGLGRGAAIRGVNIDLENVQNIIMRNVAVYDINPRFLEARDAFTLSGTSRLWLDHVTMKWVSDAFADVLSPIQAVTISNTLLDGEDASECDGLEQWAFSLYETEATVHHCHFRRLRTRAPHVSGALSRVHLYNNLYSDIAEWAVGSHCLGQVLLEGSVFSNVDVATELRVCAEGRGKIQAVAKSNSYLGKTPVFSGGSGTEPQDSVFIPEYGYNLSSAEVAEQTVRQRAGAGGPWARPLQLD